MDHPYQDIQSYDVRHLPIIRAYLDALKVPQIIDRALNCKMNNSPGRVVVGLIVDILTGRSPLYHLEEFFEHQDLETVIGADMALSAFSDTNVGRTLDRLFQYGTQKLFSEISIEAVKEFQLNTRHVHADTTSVSVWGEYVHSEESDGPTLTYGHSKDHRPDLKQFVFSLLSVEGSIPIFGKTEDGNASDKTINHSILTHISKYMAKHGVTKQDYIYIADSAFVTPDNLRLVGDYAQSDKQLFISRLPETYKECLRVRQEAVTADQWKVIGKCAVESADKNRLTATYRCHDTFVQIENQRFRAVVIHSDLFDKRRQKRLSRRLKEDKGILAKTIQSLGKVDFACQEDARQFAQNHVAGKYHQIEWAIKPKPIYKRGRPKQDQEREIAKMLFILEGAIVENTDAVTKLRDEAGCFVLLTNVATGMHQPKEILEIYKEQYGIEQNFGFLKDPLIVNDLFLKNPERIEALGLVLLIALLVWRLIERNMRKYIKENNLSIMGWDKRLTMKPTTYMMTTKFSSVHVLKKDHLRWFARPLKDFQLDYLNAMGLSEHIFLNRS